LREYVTVTKQTGYTLALIVVSTDRLWWRKLRETGHFVELGADGFLVNKMGACIEVAQDRDGWRAVMNAVMNFRVP
jgi:hypothetical protein